MEKLYDEFVNLLKKYQLSPKDIKHWNHFKLHFGKEKYIDIDTEMKKAKVIIYNELGVAKEKIKKKGIYIFINDKNQCLYVGKTKNLRTRILSHLYLSLGFKSGKSPIDKEIEEKSDWCKFFKNNIGEYEIRWIEVDHKNEHIGETLRIAVERIITSEYLYNTNNKEPIFEIDHPCKK